MPSYSTQVAVRWSDMDAFGHVNHARTVTLLEDARVELLFNRAAEHGVTELNSGIVVAKLAVQYRQPLVYCGTPVTVRLWLGELRAASFYLEYSVHNGRSGAAVATAQTQLVPYDRDRGRPRRLSDVERKYLSTFRVG